MLWALIILFGDKNTENFFPIHWDFYLQRRWGLVLLCPCDTYPATVGQHDDQAGLA